MKRWQGFRTIPSPAPALLLEFTHSQGTSTRCFPFFTPRSRNPIWVKGLGGEADSKKKSRVQHVRFPPSHCLQVSLWTLGIKASQQTFWMGVQSDTREAMLGEPPTTTFAQESLHIRAWRGRVGFGADFILAGFFCKYFFANTALPLCLTQTWRVIRLKLQPTKPPWETT